MCDEKVPGNKNQRDPDHVTQTNRVLPGRVESDY